MGMPAKSTKHIQYTFHAQPHTQHICAYSLAESKNGRARLLIVVHGRRHRVLGRRVGRLLLGGRGWKRSVSCAFQKLSSFAGCFMAKLNGSTFSPCAVPLTQHKCARARIFRVDSNDTLPNASVCVAQSHSPGQTGVQENAVHEPHTHTQTHKSVGTPSHQSNAKP